MRKKFNDLQKSHTYPTTTVGIVEDVTDAFQMGRIRVRCKAWLDGDTETKFLPFVRICSPYFGFTQNEARGVDADVSEGPVAYGQWSVPEVGSQVLVTLIDNDQNQRIYIGNVPEMFLGHTLPHGRYLDDNIPKTSAESPIEPLARNTGEAFGGNRTAPEYITRMMDRQVAAYPATEFGNRIVASKEADQRQQQITNPDGSIINRVQGYVDGKSRIYSVTTPGFHSFSMDDNPDNSRIRFRTTAGHQVIMDDTNERIYISTAKGKTWIEIDEQGTIDIFGDQDISLNSGTDINLTAKNSVRISAGTGIHMASGRDIRMHSKEDTHVKADGNLKIKATNINVEATENLTELVIGKHDEKSGTIVIESTSYDLTAPTHRMKSDNYNFDNTNIEIKGNIITESNLTVKQNALIEGNLQVDGTIKAKLDISSDLGITALMAVTGGTVVSIGAMSAGGAIAAGPGGVSSAGSISTTGILSSTADVVAGNVSLRSHVHMVPLPQHAAGTIPSPPPVPGAASLPVVPPVITIPLETQDNPTVPDVTGSPTASEGLAAEEKPAYFASRVPQHEPFTRSYLKFDETDKDDVGESTLDLFETLNTDIDSISEYIATDPLAGTGSNERGRTFTRNARWRR